MTELKDGGAPTAADAPVSAKGVGDSTVEPLVNNSVAWLPLKMIWDTDFNRGPGNLESLTKSIEENGLITPMACTPDGKLLAGRRRFSALVDLGWKSAPFLVIEPEDEAHSFRIMLDENVERKPLTDPEYASYIKQHRELVVRKRLEKSRVICAAHEPLEKSTIETIYPQEELAINLGTNGSTISRAIKVAELVEENPEWAHLKGKQILRLAKIEEREKAIENYPSGSSRLVFDTYERHIPDAFDLLITDPLYMTDVEDIDVYVRDWLGLVLPHLKDSGQAYIFTGSYFEEQRAYINELSKYERFSKQILVWEYRNTMGPSTTDRYKNNHQVVFYLRGPDALDINSASELIEQFTVQRFNAPDGRFGDGRYHAWQKPIELARLFIMHGSKAGDSVFDPFAGTGTFLLAASELKRNATGTELDPQMIEIAKRRGCRVA